MNQTRYKDAPSTIANLPNPTVTSTDATFSNIQLPTDPDGVRNIDFSIVTSSNNAKGTILST